MITFLTILFCEPWYVWHVEKVNSLMVEPLYTLIVNLKLLVCHCHWPSTRSHWQGQWAFYANIYPDLAQVIQIARLHDSTPILFPSLFYKLRGLGRAHRNGSHWHKTMSAGSGALYTDFRLLLSLVKKSLDCRLPLMMMISIKL